MLLDPAAAALQLARACREQGSDVLLLRRRPEIGVLHDRAAMQRVAGKCDRGVQHLGALAAPRKLVPGVDRGADRAARIARRRLHIEPLEGRLAQHLAVGHRVHGAAAGQRQAVEAGACV